MPSADAGARQTEVDQLRTWNERAQHGWDERIGVEHAEDGGMIAEPYHTALSWGREQGAPSAERFESDGSVAFVHDLLSGPLPAAYDQCDVFYCEPPWRTGFAAFERRAGREDAFGRSWTALLEAAMASLPQNVPAIFTLGERTSLPTPDRRLPGTENGAACVFWVYGQDRLPQLPDGLRDADLIQRLAGHFECVGDYMCGYGRTGRIFREHGKRFVMSDHNARCIGYVAEHAGTWERQQVSSDRSNCA